MSTELLPWYVNGTLTADEHAAVERILAESVVARDELALWREVAQEVAAEPTVADAGGIELGWRQLHRALNAVPVPGAWRRWRLAAAAALVAIVGAQSVYLYQIAAERDQIRQLGAAPGGVGADEWRIQVRFRPTATVQEINQLLFANGARVVDGPSALGIYELAVPRTRFADAQVAAHWFSTYSLVEQGVAPP